MTREEVHARFTKVVKRAMKKPLYTVQPAPPEKSWKETMRRGKQKGDDE